MDGLNQLRADEGGPGDDAFDADDAVQVSRCERARRHVLFAKGAFEAHEKLVILLAVAGVDLGDELFQCTLEGNYFVEGVC